MNEKKKEIVEVAYSPFIIPYSSFIIVENDEDYVRACRELSSTEASTSGLKVWVRSRHHFAWLRDFTEQIGCPAFFSEKTPRLVLAERWNVLLPDWLTDAEVIDQGLFNLNVAPQAEQTNFSNRLLAHLLGPVFQQDVFDANDLVHVIKALVSIDSKAAFKKYPIMHRALESKCKTWSQNNKEEWVKNLCSHIFENTGDLWHWLSLWACLHDYPEKLLEYVLTPEQVLFVRNIPAEAVYDLPLEPAAREQILTQIELLFEEIQSQVTSGDEFRKVLGWTSGQLFQEYHFISKILGSLHSFPRNGKVVFSSSSNLRVIFSVSEYPNISAKSLVTNHGSPSDLGMKLIPYGKSVKGAEMSPFNNFECLQCTLTAFLGSAYPKISATSMATNQSSIFKSPVMQVFNNFKLICQLSRSPSGEVVGACAVFFGLILIL